MPVDNANDEIAEASVVKADVIAECRARRPISYKEYYDKHRAAAMASLQEA